MKSLIKNILFGILIVGIIILMMYNVICIHNTNFWNFTIANGMTLLVALVVSYYLTQKNIDERNRKELYMRQLDKLQCIVVQECLYIITLDSDINKLLMEKRKINNSITILEKYAKEFGLKKEIEFIKDRAKEYADLLGEHQKDLEYLSKSSIELKRPLDLIEQKINEMEMKIFI